jgi:hypothetical protein
MSRFSFFRWVAGAALASALFFPAVTLASTGLAIQPVKLDQTLKPGDHAEGEILLTNSSDTPVDVEPSVEDFIPTAGAESIKFVDRAPGVTSVRDWIKLSTTKPFVLALGEQRTIPYSIDVPIDAEPGGHFGAVFFKATQVGGTTGSLKVGTQVGMLVLIAIPGNHLEKGQILDFTAPAFLQSGPVPFSIQFENTGTVHFEPKGSIVITNMLGQKAAEVPLGGQVVLPTSVKLLRFDWAPVGFLFGRYGATATLYDGEGDALTASTIHFWVIPVWYVVGFLIALVVIYFVLRYLRRHLRIELK